MSFHVYSNNSFACTCIEDVLHKPIKKDDMAKFSVRRLF